MAVSVYPALYNIMINTADLRVINLSSWYDFVAYLKAQQVDGSDEALRIVQTIEGCLRGGLNVWVECWVYDEIDRLIQEIADNDNLNGI